MQNWIQTTQQQSQTSTTSCQRFSTLTQSQNITRFWLWKRFTIYKMETSRRVRIDMPALYDPAVPAYENASRVAF